jgi:hypothetical protein
MKRYNRIIHQSKSKETNSAPGLVGLSIGGPTAHSHSKPTLDYMMNDQSKVGGGKKDFMKIYGVKLSQPSSVPPKVYHNRSKIVSKSSNPNLPRIDKGGSHVKLQKYDKLPKLLAI